MRNIAVFSPSDDINEHGYGSVWHMKGDSDLNEEYRCSCIYQMLSSEELFKVLFNNESIYIENDRFLKYCRKI
jgi:hypothetical protein